MFIVHVFVKVKAEHALEFEKATLDNARHSVQEPGCARFDVCRRLDDPNAFVLVEVYRTPEDADRHKQTAHYARWRDAVAPWMAEPRSSLKYENLFPADAGW